MTTVLIVEDDPWIAELMQEELEVAGFSVSGIARTLGEAEDSARKQEPDFAIVDLGLADGDFGTDVAASLRRTTKAGIIFSTGDVNDLSLTTRRLGDAVMMKPYRLSDIGRGLNIIDEIARLGHTELSFPRNFHLLGGSVADALIRS
jgi:two-component system, NtrC family, response regulator HydG